MARIAALGLAAPLALVLPPSATAGPVVPAVSAAAPERASVPAHQVAAAVSARLERQGAAHLAAETDEVLALARAAAEEVRAAKDLSTATTGQELGELDVVGSELARLERVLETPPAPRRAGPEQAVPDAASQYRPDVLARSAAVDDLRATAGEAFTVSMEVELAAQATAEARAAARWDGLAELETLVQAAEGLAAARPQARTGAPLGTSGGAAPWARTVSLTADGGRHNGALPDDVLCPVPFAPGHRLRCDAVDALTELAAAYEADTGRPLRVVSSYRTYAEQAALRAQKGWIAAQPGRSVHGLGLAVDLGDMGGLGEFDAPAYRWMQEHAPTFGWYHPPAMEPGGGGPPEPWHWEYTG